jgi:E3 Ubiquitin ligase
MFSACCELTLGLVAVIDMRLAVYAVIGIVAGIVLFYRGFRMLQFKRLVLNTPFSKIRSASMGLVEVSGMATGPQTIPAGITGAACYYYCATAWELRQSGRNREWKKVAEETLYVPFFVDDRTGLLMVDPQGADLDVHRTFRDEFDQSLFGSNMFPENVTQFLARNGIGASGNIRLEEHCIEPGYPLFILGTLAQNLNRANSAPAVHVPVPTSSIRSRSNFSFSSGGGWFQSLTGISISASLTAGASPKRIAASAPASNAGNWSSVSMDDVHPPIQNRNVQALARAVVARAVAVVAEKPQVMEQKQPAAPPQKAGFDTHPAVVLAKGAGNDPFAISSQSQRDIVRALAWKSTACIWGGPLLTMICFYILSEILGWL